MRVKIFMPVVVTYQLQRHQGAGNASAPFSGAFEVHDLDFITLRRLKDEFPFDGDLFFRASTSPGALGGGSGGAGGDGLPSTVWKDLTDDSELVPGGNEVYVKVLDLAALGAAEDEGKGRDRLDDDEVDDDAFASRAGAVLSRPLAGRATPAVLEQIHSGGFKDDSVGQTVAAAIESVGIDGEVAQGVAKAVNKGWGLASNLFGKAQTFIRSAAEAARDAAAAEGGRGGRSDGGGVPHRFNYRVAAPYAMAAAEMQCVFRNDLAPHVALLQRVWQSAYGMNR